MSNIHDEVHHMLPRYYTTLQEIYRLGCIRGLLEWDQQVMLPSLGAAERSKQLELMSTLIHQRMTSPELLSLLQELREQANLSADDEVNVREMWREVERSRKLPETFVAESARVASQSYNEWIKARPTNDFARMRPHLEKIVELAREEARLVGYSDHPYNALLDVYEPYGSLAQIKPLLTTLAEELSRLIPSIISKQATITPRLGTFAIASQHALCQRVTAAIGYSYESGRLDIAPHPFQTALGPNDIRMTTRYDEHDYLSSLFTALHEAGHAIYEDGLRKEWAGTPMGQSVSLSIHESQSRFYENIIGRSRSFSVYLHSVLGDYFPEEHRSTSPEAIWASTNRVERTLIRVEADEVTYSLHVVIRMLLEIALIGGEVEVKDLPGAWNELYARYLGITPPTDSDGVLQDVHWYSGSIGYFPTYALGNLYGAMMHETMNEQIPSLDDLVAQGNFLPIKEWLNTNVHRHGKRYTGPQLIQKITGHELAVEPFLRYIKRKFELPE